MTGDSPGNVDERILMHQQRTGRPHRMRLIAIAGLSSAAVVGGGAAAYAVDKTPSPSARQSTDAATTSAAPAATGGVPAGPRSATGRPVHQPHIDGTVTKVSASTVTVTDPDGFTRTIMTTSRTTYADGLAAPVKVGVRIHAEGTVDADGTSLDAVTIRTVPTPPAPPREAPRGGPRPGGPGRPGGSKAAPKAGDPTGDGHRSRPRAGDPTGGGKTDQGS